MSIHFLSHSWDVANLHDGIQVTLHQHELDVDTMADLIDDLVELVRENGRTKLYLDFSQVRILASIVFGKLISLDARLRAMACKLIVCNVDPFVYQMFEAGLLTEILDIRPGVPTAHAHGHSYEWE